MTLRLKEKAAENLKLPIRRLVKPTQLNLAVTTDTPAPCLTHFTIANLSDELSGTRFARTYFKLGNVGEEFDMILGTPFFKLYQFSVSVSQRAIV